MPDTIASFDTETVTAAAWAAITPSTLNPRKSFEPEALAELAASIKEQGILLPLLVRPFQESVMPSVRYEIVAGERRWRAVEWLINNEGFAQSYEIPIRVHACDDIEALKIAVLENLQRADLHPLEEAEAFALLKKRGLSTQQIADAIGKTRRHVELRIGLVEKLAEPVLEKFRQGGLNLAQARELTAAPEHVQKTIVKKIEKESYKPWRGEDVKRQVQGQMVPVRNALFDRQAYLDKGGEIVTVGAVAPGADDPDGDLLDVEPGDYFADGKLFAKLQKLACEATREELLEQGWAFVDIISWQSRWNYETSKAKDAGVIIVMSHDGEVEIAEGMKPRARAAGGASTASPEQPQAIPPIGRAHIAQAQMRKSHALQHAVAATPHIAKALLVTALLLPHYATCVELDVTHYGEPFVAAGVLAAIKKAAPKGTDATVYKALIALTPAKLDQLLASLIARQVYSGNYEWADELGDDVLTCQVASDLGLAGNEAEHGLVLQDDDLEGLSDEALSIVYKSLTGWEPTAANDLRADIVATAKSRGDYVLPTLTFGDEKTLVKALLKPAAAKTKKPAAKAAAKAKAKKGPAKKTAKKKAKR